jgi:hypothetical protein
MLLIMPDRGELREFIENVQMASRKVLEKLEIRRRSSLFSSFEVFSKNVIVNLQNFPKSKIDELDLETAILLNEIQFVNAFFKEFIKDANNGFIKAIEALKIALKSLIDFSSDRLKKLWTLASELLELATLYLN